MTLTDAHRRAADAYGVFGARTVSFAHLGRNRVRRGVGEIIPHESCQGVLVFVRLHIARESLQCIGVTRRQGDWVDERFPESGRARFFAVQKLLAEFASLQTVVFIRETLCELFHRELTSLDIQARGVDFVVRREGAYETRDDVHDSFHALGVDGAKTTGVQRRSTELVDWSVGILG